MSPGRGDLNLLLLSWQRGYSTNSFPGRRQELLQRCRDRIEREGGKQRDNLLAVTQVFARLHFDKPEWLAILGGSKAMFESPFIQELVSESERKGLVKAILRFLETRFGSLTPMIMAGLKQVKEEKKLVGLVDQAASCANLHAFEDALRQEFPAPQPASTRGKRRSRKPPE